MTAIRRRSPCFYARFDERYLNGQTRMQATTSCPTLCPGQVLKVTGGEEVAGEFAEGVLVTAMHSHARRDADFAVEFAGIPDSPDVGYRPEPGARPVMAGTLPALRDQHPGKRHLRAYRQTRTLPGEYAV